MLRVYLFITIITSLVIKYIDCSRVNVEITSNTPVVLGANVEFNAKLLTDGELIEDDYRYSWNDDGIPQHSLNVII